MKKYRFEGWYAYWFLIFVLFVLFLYFESAKLCFKMDDKNTMFREILLLKLKGEYVKFMLTKKFLIFHIQVKQIFLSISSSYVRIAAKYLQIAASICIQMCKLTSRRLSKKLIKWEKLGSVIHEETKVERDYYSIAKRKFESLKKLMKYPD